MLTHTDVLGSLELIRVCGRVTWPKIQPPDRGPATPVTKQPISTHSFVTPPLAGAQVHFSKRQRLFAQVCAGAFADVCESGMRDQQGAEPVQRRV